MIDEKTAKSNIRKAREKSGVSQAELSEKTGVSVTSIRKIEKGGTAVINRNVYGIACALGVSVESLILGYNPDSQVLRSGIDLNEELDSVKSFYEKKIDEKNNEIAEKDLQIAKLKSEIDKHEAFARSQQAMIDFLQKHTNL